MTIPFGVFALGADGLPYWRYVLTLPENHALEEAAIHELFAVIAFVLDEHQVLIDQTGTGG